MGYAISGKLIKSPRCEAERKPLPVGLVIDTYLPGEDFELGLISRHHHYSHAEQRLLPGASTSTRSLSAIIEGYIKKGVAPCEEEATHRD